jgi:hypothetical protein
MATKKTATKETASPVEQLSTRFRVKWGNGIDDLFDDTYDFWVDNDGDIRVEDLYFNSSQQAAKVLRNMADFLEAYNQKMLGK